MAACDFGKQIKKALIDRDLTQVDLAQMIGTSPRYVGFIIGGQKNAGKYEQPIRAALGLVHERIGFANKEVHQ